MFSKKNALLFFLFAIASSLVGQEDSTYAERVYWNGWYRLQWSDFQGDVDMSRMVAAESSFILPYHTSSHNDGLISVQLYACFMRSTSWSREEFRTNLLLQHEQLHFDIAELYRRKIIKALVETKMKEEDFHANFQAILDQYWKKEYHERQALYDKETNFSRVIKKQIEWNEIIADELTSLEEFDYTDLTIVFEED